MRNPPSLPPSRPGRQRGSFGRWVGDGALGHLALAITGGGAALVACGSVPEQSVVTGEPTPGLDWSGGTPSFLTEVVKATPYTGSDPTVLEAQDRLPTGSALHAEVILRSCGPLGGVCHNRKEYPALHTPASFLETIGAPCNIQSGTIEAIYDRCERPGDRIRLAGGGEKEIGWLELVPNENAGEEGGDEVEPSPDMPGLHLHLAEPVSPPNEDEDRNRTTVQFVRTFVQGGEVQDLSYATYAGRWHLFDDGYHVVAEVPENRVDEITALLQVGIEQGDLNRNGTFGARPDDTGVTRGPVSLIEPGNPETSYLIARMRGHMMGEPIPGSRMPLANPPFSVAEMLALFCFVEGLPEDGMVNLASDIDYAGCSYADPITHAALAVEGVGSGWADRISPLLEGNCGGCHSADRAYGDLVLVGDGVYEMLTETISPTDPLRRKYIEPGNPQASYLYLKLIGDPSIDGDAMPVDPIAGVRTLAQEELSDVETWITNGAPP